MTSTRVFHQQKPLISAANSFARVLFSRLPRFFCGTGTCSRIYQRCFYFSIHFGLRYLRCRFLFFQLENALFASCRTSESRLWLMRMMARPGWKMIPIINIFSKIYSCCWCFDIIYCFLNYTDVNTKNRTFEGYLFADIMQRNFFARNFLREFSFPKW